MLLHLSQLDPLAIRIRGGCGGSAPADDARRGVTEHEGQLPIERRAAAQDAQVEKLLGPPAGSVVELQHELALLDGVEGARVAVDAARRHDLAQRTLAGEGGRGAGAGQTRDERDAEADRVVRGLLHAPAQPLAGRDAQPPLLGVARGADELAPRRRWHRLQCQRLQTRSGVGGQDLRRRVGRIVERRGQPTRRRARRQLLQPGCQLARRRRRCCCSERGGQRARRRRRRRSGGLEGGGGGSRPRRCIGDVAELHARGADFVYQLAPPWAAETLVVLASTVEFFVEIFLNVEDLPNGLRA